MPPEVIVPPPAVGRWTRPAGHRNDLALERRELRELERVERVAEQVATVDLGEHRFEVVTPTRVDEAEEASAVHIGLAPLTVAELREDLRPSHGPVRAVSRQSRPAARRPSAAR